MNNVSLLGHKIYYPYDPRERKFEVQDNLNACFLNIELFKEVAIKE
jgi:hypothetical protein